MIETCVAFSLSESFAFEGLAEYCQMNFNSQTYREVIKVDFQRQEFHLFEFGVVVFWGAKGYSPELFFSQIKPFLLTPLRERTLEFFDVSLENPGNGNFKIRRDLIQLDSHDPLLRVGISFAMAQSIRLGDMEEFVFSEVDEHSNIPQELAQKGDLKLSRKEMARIRGKIFYTESRINLKYDLLDKPDFLWDNPEYDDYYNKTYEYLEIGQRINVLNKKLSVLRDILNILADELQFKHSTKLEWIIIILIAIEIVMSLGEYGYRLLMASH